MKKMLIAMLVVTLFAAQGIAIAEDVVANVQADAVAADSENMVIGDALAVEDVVTPEGDEMALIEETEEVVPAAEATM